MVKVAFISAIFGTYETSTKPFVQQQTNDQFEVDFICFTDSPDTLTNAAGWIVDSSPYHMTHRPSVYHPEKQNLFENNQHTFNVAKYYKQSFHNIPRLAAYDVVIWLDGTVEIVSPHAAQTIIALFQKHRERRIITWDHYWYYGGGTLEQEVRASNFFRYNSTHWFGQNQPLQDVNKQFAAYIADGFSEVGLWCTCFVAFDMKDKEWTSLFLDTWYEQTLTYTTQHQVGFPYCVFKLNHMPYTLPDETTRGNFDRSDLHVKSNHYE